MDTFFKNILENVSLALGYHSAIADNIQVNVFLHLTKTSRLNKSTQRNTFKGIKAS